MYLLARKLGFADEMFKHIALEGPANTVPVVEDMLREINRGTWAVGYTGQSPERLKLHMESTRRSSTPATLRGREARWRANTTACPGRAGARRSRQHPDRPSSYT